MGRRRKSENILKEALDGGSNLEILKAQRIMIFEILSDEELEVRDKVQLMNSLTKVTADIVKLEGGKEMFDDDIEASYNEDYFLRTELK